MNNVAFGGYDPRPQAPLRLLRDDRRRHGRGRGGRRRSSGVHTHMTNSLNTPIEALENYLPLKIRSYGLGKGSGGAGPIRAETASSGNTNSRVPVDLTVISERRRFAPYGARGGEPAASGRNSVDLPGPDADPRRQGQRQARPRRRPPRRDPGRRRIRQARGLEQGGSR
ncbi:MAG: hydantoinase B/oxoprolinase family protein [Desulfobacterales bacterium]|nr:hydantoinase B/oxoprolinase family protein [Desulfobacterales bacterium]